MTETVKIPNLGESITEATIGKWFKREGDYVALDEPIAELETDKVAMEVSAPVAGTLKSILVSEGDTVEIGAAIAEIEPGEAKPAAMPQAPAKAPEKEKNEKILTPSARKLVKEHDVDVSEVTGTSKGGRIGKEDVLKAISGKPVSAPAPAKLREERVRMTRMRLRIAERLKEAQNTAAILTTFNEVDMSAVINARSRNKELFFKKHGVKLGFMSFFTKACVHALKEIPAVNGEIDGAEIVYKNHYDIGVAISTPSGLVVPVLRDADLMSFADIEKKIFDLGTRARDGKLALEELQGGTFTISNGGVFGSLLSTPILNPPQSAILGMHKIEQRPVAVDGEVVIRPMMYLALSYDHRIIDGREAVIFLVRIKELLEDTDKLLLDL
ncbi:MAG: 2-oxoglutarate dehydrogenase complex dihydrolipoyllysine-residue succinyltransferase [Proteobacteria bacterium]|nr:2-oxoglutarate dehydrogenase complex dihydrolipoyllysine-residue succinyltransferase [Pseudomonadota bacterium]